MVKEVFLDSETAIGLISTPPGPYPQEAVVPPKEMTHIRDEINRVTQSRRMLAHGLVTPQLGQADLDFMDHAGGHAEGRRLEGLHRRRPKGFDRGWFVDDEKIAYPDARAGPQARDQARSACTRACRSGRSRTTTIRAT